MHVVRQLETVDWNQFIEANDRANIFHTPAMYEVFDGAKGCSPRVWAVADKKGRIRAIMPTVDMTVFNGVMRSWTTRTVLHGGMLSDTDDGSQEAVDFMLRAYRREAPGSTLFTEFRNLADMGELQPVLEGTGFAFEPHLNYLIDLTCPESELWTKIRPNARRNVRKARNSGVAIEDITDANRVGSAYELLKQVYKRIQVALPDRSLFESAFRVLYPRGMMRILMARQGDVDIGTLALLIYRGTMHYWYTGAPRQYSAYRPADFLVWHSLLLGQQIGCKTFEFGGAGRPDQVYRVRDFKAKFGGDLVNFGRNVCVHAPLRLRVSRVGYELVRRFL